MWETVCDVLWCGCDMLCDMDHGMKVERTGVCAATRETIWRTCFEDVEQWNKWVRPVSLLSLHCVRAHRPHDSLRC